MHQAPPMIGAIANDYYIGNIVQRVCPEPFPFFYDVVPISLSVYNGFCVLPFMLKQVANLNEDYNLVMKHVIYYGAFAIGWFILDYTLTGCKFKIICSAHLLCEYAN